ncbi:hypothetical protein Tco_0312662 [Tanacetum coccineum]
MDDPDITMEEYIRLEEEKARRSGKVYNWETGTYGKIWYDEDVHDLRSVETEFPAVVFNDALTSEVLRIENEAKTGIFGFDSIKFTYYSRSRRSRKNSPSIALERARDLESNGAFIAYWAGP